MQTNNSTKTSCWIEFPLQDSQCEGVMGATEWADFCRKHTTDDVNDSAGCGNPKGLPPVHCTAFYVGKATAEERERIVREALPLWSEISAFSTYVGAFEPMGSYYEDDCYSAVAVDIPESLMPRIITARRHFYEKLCEMGWKGIWAPEERPWNPHLTLFQYNDLTNMNNHLEKVLNNAEAVGPIREQMMMFDKPVLAYRDSERRVHRIAIPHNMADM